MANATLTSSDDAAAMDHRNLELLLMVVMMTHSLLRNEGAAADDNVQFQRMKEKVRALSMAINRRDQTIISRELLAVSQWLLDEQLRSLDGREQGRVGVSSSSSDHQLMDGAAASKKKAAAAKKKKRNRRNKAAAKHKKGTKLMSWLGGGIISLIMMAAFSSVTTLIALSLIHQSDGSSEGKAPPSLPPTTSTSLRQRDLQSSNMALTSPTSKSPLPIVAQSPVFSPAADAFNNDRRMKADETFPSPFPSMYNNTPTDTPDWYDYYGYDCSWYEVMDDPGCPKYGNRTAHDSSTAQGSAKDNCYYCQHNVDSNVSPTKAPSSSGTCVDTEGWEDIEGDGCEWYQENDTPECSIYGNDVDYLVTMGPASDNCCYCKDPTCEDYKSGCLAYSNYWSSDVASVCNKAASCSCETADNSKNVTNLLYGSKETVGLYNECKCNFWLRLCDDTQVAEACDYAAEYCCGDYYITEDFTFDLLNSPQCYCDFFNYVGHKLTPKALPFPAENSFSNLCGQGNWYSSIEDEKVSLMALYDETNGQKWKHNSGWTNENISHCQWYGISCDHEGYVTSIDLRDNNLEGQFPVYTRNEYQGALILKNDWRQTKYGLANLHKLKTLDLAENKLKGKIEYRPLYNLRSLTDFDVSGNQISGEVDALVSPLLSFANFSNNNFTSMRRFEKYKVSSFQSLRYCDVSNNAIQEDATKILENIPPNIDHFIASNNHFNGSLPDSLNNLQKLRHFNMTSNDLSGELPGFADSFATLQELDVSNQTVGFTGSIPEDIWRSLSLKVLNLAGNKLNGTIPSTVGNLAVLEEIDLSYNELSSVIPSELGQLRGVSVFLEDNRFNSTAPLSLCVEREVEEFDLAKNTTFCPIERNALSDLYNSAKGAEWTDGSKWLDEYASYCDWKGVTCDDDRNHTIKLNLTNNGLSGRLSESIGKLKFITWLDLSDNDIKGSIPTELGELSKLTHLRLSYNAFTGAAPEGLGDMKELQLLQLQSNRIINLPNIPRLNDSLYNKSTFITDCGVPSAFDQALNCDNCTMCCNANEECHPQEGTEIATKLGMKGYGYGYLEFAALLIGCFCLLCCIIVLLFYVIDKRKNHGITLTPAMEQKRKDEEYAVSKIGKDSVYSYFVTNSKFGWLAAFATVLVQAGILVFFVKASEANLQDDAIDIKFAWKCPRDTVVCKDTGIVGNEAWFIFYVLMAAFLAKDIISGMKLIYLSSKRRHDRWSRFRYFIGGMLLCSITLFAVYVSAIYNRAIATSDTEMIANSVIVLFVMEMDEWIFSDLEAINEKWISRDDAWSETEAGNGVTEIEMKEEIELHKAQIESQQEQIEAQHEELGMFRVNGEYT